MKIFRTSRKNAFCQLKISGLSLLEILIVLAIGGIILVFAIPSYQGLLKDKRQLQAEARLLDIQQRLVTYFGNNSTYTTSLDEINYKHATASADNNLYFNMSIKPCQNKTIATCAMIIASPTVQEDDYLWMTTVSDAVNISSSPP